MNKHAQYKSSSIYNFCPIPSKVTEEKSKNEPFLGQSDNTGHDKGNGEADGAPNYLKTNNSFIVMQTSCLNNSSGRIKSAGFTSDSGSNTTK